MPSTPLCLALSFGSPNNLSQQGFPGCFRGMLKATDLMLVLSCLFSLACSLYWAPQSLLLDSQSAQSDDGFAVYL